MADYILDVSPRGDAAGLFLGAGAAASLGLVVLPKAWRVGPRRRWVLDWAKGDVIVRCYEGDQVLVRTSSQGLEAVLRTIMNSSGGRAVGGLIAPGSFSDRHIPSEAGQATGQDLAALAGLTRMWVERVRRGASAGMLPHGPTGSSLLRPLLYSDFLAEVMGRLGRLRRGYEERTEHILGIRGRPSERSLQRVLAQSSLRVECRFDEFTHETPLARTLATALDVIVGDRGVISWLFRASGLPAPSDKAAEARRLLFDVVPYPRAEALHVARTLTLGRLDAAWSHALSLAMRVLTPTGEESSLDSASTSLRTVSLPTAQIWEDLVYESLARALGPTRVENLNESGRTRLASIRPPWAIGGHSPVPDIVAEIGSGARLIVDAKYKEPGPTPSIEDQYQLFAYSHLARFGTATPTHCVLAYPDYGPATILVDAPRTDESDDPPSLCALRLPFPSPGDVRDLAAWTDFSNRGGAAIRAFLHAVG